MPRQLPEQLSAEARGLYSTIGGFVSAGVGADSTYRMIREAGARIPRAQVRQIAGELRTAMGYRRSLATLDPLDPVPARLYVPTDRIRKDGFTTIIATTLVDSVTGYTIVKHYTYISGSPPAPDEAFAEAIDAAKKGGSWEGLEVLAQVIRDAWIRKS